MVNIVPGLPKMQAQSKKLSYHINHAKVAETKTSCTIKSAGVEVIQVHVTQVTTRGVLNTNPIAIMMDVLNTILMVIWSVQIKTNRFKINCLTNFI